MVEKARGQLMKTKEGKNGINYDRLLNEVMRNRLVAACLPDEVLYI